MINIISVSIGIVIFLFSMCCFRRIFVLTKGFKLQVWWLILAILIIFFTFGYLAFAYFLITGHELVNYPFLISQVFLFGAIFVLITSILFYLTVKQIIKKSQALIQAKTKLQKYSKGLEKLVAERTKKLELTHNKALKHEKEIQRLKDQFVFVAAHELRAPVTAIGWLLEMLKEEKNLKKLSPEAIEAFQDLEANKQRLIELVEDLLNVARIEYGTFKVEPKRIDLIKNINEALREMKFVAKKSRVKLKLKTEQKQLFSFADPKRTKEILINFIGNAIKYNKINGEVTITAAKKNNHIEISVKDTGIGMTKAEMKKLFNKFYRIENKDTKAISGTGLGLFISKQMIELMKGKISAQSEGRNKGSTFSFSLPIKKK